LHCGISAALAHQFLKHPVHHTDVEVDVFVQAGAEPVDEGHCADVQAFLVCIGRANAVRLQALRNHPQKDAQHHAQHRSVALHEVPQPLGHGEHPLAHRQAGEYVIVQVRCCLHHAPGGARGADSRPLQEKATK
jgi:hypothetical protein